MSNIALFMHAWLWFASILPIKIIEKFYNSQPVLMDNSISPHHCAGFQTSAMAYHMENTVGISNFSKHNSDEETISNESPNSYTKFQRRQAKASGEF